MAQIYVQHLSTKGDASEYAAQVAAFEQLMKERKLDPGTWKMKVSTRHTMDHKFYRVFTVTRKVLPKQVGKRRAKAR